MRNPKIIRPRPDSEEYYGDKNLDIDIIEVEERHRIKSEARRQKLRKKRMRLNARTK